MLSFNVLWDIFSFSLEYSLYLTGFSMVRASPRKTKVETRTRVNHHVSVHIANHLQKRGRRNENSPHTLVNANSLHRCHYRRNIQLPEPAGTASGPGITQFNPAADQWPDSRYAGAQRFTRLAWDSVRETTPG